MELELLRALILIANTCFLQNSCEDCPCENFVAKCLASGEQRADSYDQSRFSGQQPTLPEIFTSMINLNANRKVDALGRIVIPSKLRDKFAIEPGDKVEFFSTYVDGVMYLCMACPHAAPPREETEN